MQSRAEAAQRDHAGRGRKERFDPLTENVLLVGNTVPLDMVAAVAAEIRGALDRLTARSAETKANATRTEATVGASVAT